MDPVTRWGAGAKNMNLYEPFARLEVNFYHFIHFLSAGGDPKTKIFFLMFLSLPQHIEFSKTSL